MDGTGGNDIWGWFDAQTGQEYALMGLQNGTAFVDITDPEDPVFLGRLPTQTTSSIWRDIKVHQDHAYIVADAAGAHGMQVFDLTQLRGVSGPQAWQPDTVYGDFQNAHNLAINEDTGFAYAVGTNTCSGGLHMIDIRDPVNPLFAGCEFRRARDLRELQRESRRDRRRDEQSGPGAVIRNGLSAARFPAPGLVD
jgi:choice-of-anchor B domain-containing protein